MEFKHFAAVVTKQFNKMASEGPLFRMDLQKNDLWDAYLASFPEGTNPMRKERTEHDCQTCKNFVRHAGGIVSIVDNRLVSVWDVEVEEPFRSVVETLASLVRSVPVANVFVTTEPKAGLKYNVDITDNVTKWYHLFAEFPAKCVKGKTEVGPIGSEARANKDVLLRSLEELSVQAINEVMEVIEQGSLYRGTEFKGLVEAFAELKKEYDALANSDSVQSNSLDLFAWSKSIGTSGALCKFRSTVIGTLISDLSEGVDLDKALKSYESKVAPSNYKRPTAVATKAMIQKAQETITELGYMSSLERRFATIEDITINNILFANRAAKKQMNVFDQLSSAIPERVAKLDKVEEVGIDKFLSDILPKAESIEVLFENKHTGNLVSLIAPVDPESKNMFKWDNKFSWSYNGEIADSMREQVVARGGRVDGVLRFTHSWNNPDMGRNQSLMDLHVFMPGHNTPEDGIHENYGSKHTNRVGWNNRQDPRSGGKQDVDYTSAAPEGFIPLENITFPKLSQMPEGKYILKIHNWALRGKTDSGFKAEVEFDGEVYRYIFQRPLKHHEWVTVAEVTLKNGVFSIEHKIPTDSQTSVEKWGINTGTFRKVNVVMNSPNYWDEKSNGNKHFFFMLEGCLNDGKARGFFNEFLKEELNVHRKVFEMVGAKMRTEESDRQLSGLGFSSTQRNSLICKVKGSFARTIKINF